MRRVCIPILLIVMSCAAAEGSWFSVPAKDMKGPNTVEALYCPIPEQERKEYIEKLEDKEIFSISISDAMRICGKRVIESDKRTDFHPYVVRGLFVNEYTGEYRVVVHHQDLWVSHNSLAKGGTPVEKSALVVFLRTRPETIYVTAYADE